MKHVLKVVKIRWCECCHELLPRRCDRCRKHPGRKPRTIEILGEVKLLEVGPCGCCARVQCQRPSCPKTKWIRINKRSGAHRLKAHFCSTNCNLLVVQAANRKPKIAVTCAYKPCGTVRMMAPSEAKSRVGGFCSPKCYHLDRVLKNHQRRLLEADGDDSVQTFCCNSASCRGDATDHERTPNGNYQCVRCRMIVPLPGITNKLQPVPA